MTDMTDRDLEHIRIPNSASYFPISLADLFLVAPVASRLLFRTTLPGRLLQAFALGAYAGSALLDWARRQGVRKVDFRARFGAEPRRVAPTPPEARRLDAERLVGELNDGFVPMTLDRRELARRVDRYLTDFIARLTGQRVETSAEVRDFMLAQLVFPFALGACDPLTGDVALFRPLGPFEPHVLAHEFAHRKGYWKELEAQVLAYLALERSGEPALVQSARCERLYRQLWLLSGEGDEAADVRSRRRRYIDLVESAGLRPELVAAFRARSPTPSLYDRSVGRAARELYDLRMRLTGQTGLSDYDQGFTDFLYAAGQ